VILLVIARTWRALFSIVLDEEAARVGGLPVDRLNLVLSALAAVTVVAGMRVVGILLVAALMVLPVGAAQRLATSFKATLMVAAALGAGSAVAGLAAARVWGLAPGGTIVLVAAAVFVVASAVGGRSTTLHLFGRASGA
jgi:zinc transport system permease protein